MQCVCVIDENGGQLNGVRIIFMRTCSAAGYSNPLVLVVKGLLVDELIMTDEQFEVIAWYSHVGN